MSSVAPVVFFVWRRPEQTRQVFEQIRKARPRHLLIVADAPRTGNQEEKALWEETINIVTEVDWPCDFRLEQADRNLGLRERLMTGLDLAFSLYEAALILEDDCLPSETFFTFGTEMLNRYSEQPKVALISGSNFAPIESTASYHYSRAPYIWGWGGWARSWNEFRASPQVESWSKEETSQVMKTFASKLQARQFRKMMLAASTLNTWDISFAVWIRQMGLLSVVPKKNLIENIGFGPTATHTKFEAFDVQAERDEISPPFLAPALLEPDDKREREMWRRKSLRWITFPIGHPINFLRRVARHLLP